MRIYGIGGCCCVDSVAVLKLTVKLVAGGLAYPEM